VQRQKAQKYAKRTDEPQKRFYMDFGFMRASASDYDGRDKTRARVIKTWDGYGKRRSKLDCHDFKGIFLEYTATDQNIIYLDMDYERVKPSHHAQFDEEWYLQPSRPPAPQLLYDLGVRPDEDPIPLALEVDKQSHTVGTVELVTVPWPPIAPLNGPKDKWCPPPPSLCLHLPLRTILDNYRPTSAKASRAKARQSTTWADEIVDEYGIGKQDMAVIYMSPSPYHEAFQQTMDIRKFDMSTHATAGLEFYKSGQCLHLKSIASSTPAAKIPDWRSCIRGAWLIKVNGTDVASPDNVALALKLLHHNEMAKVKLLFSHPEIRPNLSQDGMAVFHWVWTYAIKAVASRIKARWACDGSPRSGQAQILDETYANFVDQTSARLFYAIVAAENLAVFGADVPNAFAKAPPPK
jgi:hypothetical protein